MKLPLNKALTCAFHRFMRFEACEWFQTVKKYEYSSLQDCRNLQKELLADLLNYSIRNVPYYKKILKERDLNIGKNNVFSRIKEFPPLTKEILRENFRELKSDSYKGRYLTRTSGGSTGEPAVFLHDRTYLQKNAALKQLFFEWAGRKPYESVIRLWGAGRDSGNFLKVFCRDHILNVKILDSYKMSEENMHKYTEIINTRKPKVIEAYVESLYELALFIKRKNLEIFSPSGIIATAGTLYPEMKDFIEEVFKCEVLNRYGSREAGDMCCSCKEGKGLHQNIFNHYIEILDDKMRACGPGDMGYIYVTVLHNRIMPLIRYKIGDLAMADADEMCSCGRGLPLLKEIRGRETEHFINSRGELIYAGYFRKLLYGLSWVRKYKIVQKNFDRIIYYVVREDGISVKKDELERIKSKAAKALGEGGRIEVEFVKKLAPQNSGKFLYTVCEVPRKKISEIEGFSNQFVRD